MKNFFLSILVFSVFVIILDACKKDPPPVIPEELVSRSNVKPLGVTGLTLDTAASDLANGIFVFKSLDSTPNVEVGDVLVSGEGDGYIRIITSITISGNTYTIQTTQGTLEDVFIKGNLVFDFNLNFIKIGSNFGLIDSVKERTLFQDPTLAVVAKSVWLRYAPTFRFDIWFDTTGISSCDITSTNATYSTTSTITVTAAQAANLVNQIDTLRRYKKIYTAWRFPDGNPTPVVVRLDMDWIAEYTVTTGSAVTNTLYSYRQGNQTVGASYEAGQAWQSNYAFNPTESFNSTQPPGIGNVTIKMTTRPVLAFKIMGLPGPHLTMGTKSEVTSRRDATFGDWDLTGENWHETTWGVTGAIFGSNVPDLAKQTWETPRLGFSIPHTLEKISGDNQRAFENQPLPNSIKVKVLDSRGVAAKSVPVHFNIKTGNGTVTPSLVLTDQNGFAQANWKLGNRQPPLQELEVRAKRGDLSDINGSPMVFQAFIDTPISCGTMIDKDGNVYPAVIVGGECWMTENLSTRKYDNNTSIPQRQDSAQWAADGQLGLPAWSNYFNDPAYGLEKGRIYNWYVTNSTTDKVCPAGWHVPTLADYNKMFDSLGGLTQAGRKMKLEGTDVNTWDVPNLANNISGLSIVAAGSREQIPPDDYWTGGLKEAIFWTATPFNTTSAYAIRVTNISPAVSIITRPKGRGYSIRCVKD